MGEWVCVCVCVCACVRVHGSLSGCVYVYLCDNVCARGCAPVYACGWIDDVGVVL